MKNDENKVLNDIIDDNKNNEINYSVMIEKLQKEFEIENDKLNNTIKEQEKNIFYLKSDIENIKRNGLKEIQSSVNRQVSKVITVFLSVFDDYQRSIEYAEQYNNKNLLEGLLITYNTFLKALKDLEVIEIDTTKLFDPTLHEAITVINDNTKESNSIVQVVQKGFMYKGQVLRPAKVIIVS